MKEQYIKQVSRALSVPRKQKKDILRDLEEAFASAKEHGETEEQVIERLGTPEEFAAGMSESAAQKGISPKKVAALLCAVAVIAVLGVLAGVYAPEIFKYGNPIPYLKAAKLLDDENRFAIVEDKSAEGVVIISSEPDWHDVLGYINQTYGTGFYMQVDDTFVFTHGENREIKIPVGTEPYLDKYTVWYIPLAITELPPYHYLLDSSILLENVFRVESATKEHVRELFGEPSVSDSQNNKDIYYDCLANQVSFTYDENGNILTVRKKGAVLWTVTAGSTEYEVRHDALIIDNRSQK